MAELINLQVVLKRETPAAVLVEYDEVNLPAWLPKSLIELAPDKNGRTHTVTLPQWLAEEKGMV